jgi:serine protease Do
MPVAGSTDARSAPDDNPTHTMPDRSSKSVAGNGLGRRRAPDAVSSAKRHVSPSGLQNSVTMGVISSAWRQPDPDNPMVYLQTDAPINPGNSGGPLVDVTGEIVGLNTFIISSSGGNEGLGFAIPAPVVEFVYHSLRDYGRVDHVDIGVVAQTVTAAIAEGLGLSQEWGVLIADVMADGPAGSAGMHVGDLVLSVDGHAMRGLTELAAALYQHSPDRPLRRR